MITSWAMGESTRSTLIVNLGGGGGGGGANHYSFV